MSGITDRRRLLLGLVSAASCLSILPAPGVSSVLPLRFALTPVLLTSDLAMIEELRAYLSRTLERPVHLITRRTYQEITALLVSRQVDAAWICGYPFVSFRDQLALVAVPLWNGKPLYQSYLICRHGSQAASLADLAGSVHAFSDPDSNSGYLVTAAALAEMSTTPSHFFKHFFYTYGHRNVVRAVAAGLAASGSVDGYVYEVLKTTEPELVAQTRIMRRSELLGFPPVACAAADAHTPEMARLREALVSMPEHEDGRRVLGMLRLDGFRIETAELFQDIAEKMKMVRGLAE